MKKIFVICSLFLLLTGCGKVNDKDVVKEFGKNINKSNGYILNGELEILNNDEVYNYDVEVGHKKDTYYKVTLTNKKNDHTQVILKNDEGVFILTPSLNKSFKFQSDWPYSNSQVYLLGALYSDMENDDDKEFKKTKDGYELITKVSYPNNKKLIKQKILFDNKFNLLEVKVYDKDDLICMSMKFDDIDYSPNFKDNYFEMLTDLAYYFNYDQAKLSYLKDKLMELKPNDFLKVFKDDKSIRAILDYYTVITNSFNSFDTDELQDDITSLYDNLINNIDDILKDYA